MTQTDQEQLARSTRYRSLSNFYMADQRRIDSREVDVGLWWREDAGGPLHRAAWIKDTGELYLVRLGAPGDGDGVGAVEGGDVEVLAVVEDRERLESILEGWREECGAPDSLAWLRERAARLGERVRVAQLKLTAAVSAGSAMLGAAAVALELA